MLFGSDAIGVTAIAEQVGLNTYSESVVAQLILEATSLNTQSPIYDSLVETSFFNITINVDTANTFTLSSSEQGDLVGGATEYSNKSYFEGIHDTSFTVTGTTNNFFTLNPTETGVLEIVGPPLGGVFPVIPEVATGGLVFGSWTISQHYTFLLQEFDNTEGHLAINGTSGEVYVIAGGGGGSTDIPQIWIG